MLCFRGRSVIKISGIAIRHNGFSPIPVWASAWPGPARWEGAESIYCGGAGRSALCFASGAFKVAAGVSKRLLEGFLAADCEASKGRKREVIDGRRRQISGGDKIIRAAPDEGDGI